jgi:putative effector of murein hydrolase
MTVALVLIAGILGAALMGTVTWSTAIWFAVAVGVLAGVAAKFHRHAELPDSVRLH